MAITLYGTADDADAYMEARGATAWASGSDDAKLSARFRGSNYIDNLYGYRFPGVPTGGLDQDRAWPRTGAETINGEAINPTYIPKQVIYASYEAALLEFTSPGSLSVLVSENERKKRVKAGSVEVEYADSGADSAIAGAAPMSSTIEGLLYQLIGAVNVFPGILVV